MIFFPNQRVLVILFDRSIHSMPALEKMSALTAGRHSSSGYEGFLRFFPFRFDFCFDTFVEQTLSEFI